MVIDPTTSPATPTTALALRPGDWPAFRGPGRDANVRGLRIATDWDARPPKKLWSQQVGPAWSSIAVVAGRCFTQEQRGDTELVVCRDALRHPPGMAKGILDGRLCRYNAIARCDLRIDSAYGGVRIE